MNLISAQWIFGVFAIFGILLSMQVAQTYWLWSHIRENNKVHNDLANTVAGIVEAAKIYKDTQTALLEILRSTTAQHADMYRDMAARFATLEERSNHHGQELRRIATNVHDLRTESRTAITANAEALRAEIKQLRMR